MRISLFLKLLLAALVIPGAIALSFNSFIKPRLVNLIQDQKIESAKMVADVSAAMVLQGIEKGCSQQVINDLIQELAIRTSGVAVITIPACGSNDPAIFNRDGYRTQPDLYNALGGESIQQMRISNLPGQAVIQIYKSIMVNQHVIGALQIELTTTNPSYEISSVITSFYLFLLLGAAIAAAFSFFLSFFHSRRINNAAKLLNSVTGIKNFQIDTKSNILSDEIESLEIFIKKIGSSLHDQIEEYSSNNKVFSSILANMSDGILVVDQNGQVKLINQAAAAFFSIEIQQTEGHSLVKAIRNHIIEDAFEKCRLSQQVQITEIEINPAHRYIRCIASPFSAELSGSVLLLFQDLTRVHQLEIVRQDFVSNVSHELRTPLASLKALVETVQESAGHDPAATEKFLAMMDNEIDNLTQMVQELLELSKIESGKVPLALEMHTADEIINHAIERMRLQAERAKLDLAVEIGPALPKIMVDINRLEQVLVNLIHNAIKFSPPGGRITIAARHLNQSVTFSVSDKGIGIPSRDLERIFERFFKVDRARSIQGTGLGLSIARHLVEAHGGKIWAESKPGEGSTFFFSLNTDN
jgi:two-component system, OmpR family, phosphate regulon sensor histidine kinase PhoR